VKSNNLEFNLHLPQTLAPKIISND